MGPIRPMPGKRNGIRMLRTPGILQTKGRHKVRKRTGPVISPRRKGITSPTIHVRIDYGVKIAAQYARDLCIKYGIQEFEENIPLAGSIRTINVRVEKW